MGLLILNVDHVPTHLLGPYGNSSVPTPTLNAWAARGVTADAVFHSGIGDVLSGTSSLAQFRRRADLCLSPGADGQSMWPVLPCELDDDANFHLIPVSKASRLAKQWDDTALAKYLERALSKWTEATLPKDSIVWLDLPLLSGPWDAPLEWRHYLAGDDDPEVYSDLEPPYLIWPSEGFGGLFVDDSFDPDLRLSYEHAAGAMIMLLDHACEWLQTCVEALPRGSETSILLTAESGFSLGEHFGIGSFPDRTWAEESHVPMLLFVGAAGKYPVRVPLITSQRQCLSRWLMESDEPPAPFTSHLAKLDYDRFVEQALQVQQPLDSDSRDSFHHHAVVSRSPNQIAIRTIFWTFVWKVSHRPQLFVRPDDRFEQNDVASRCQALMSHIQWYLPELLFYFATDENRSLPDHLFETWCRACETIAQDSGTPEPQSWSQRLADQQHGRLMKLGELPELIWTEVT
jgi:hypothetical protein